MLVIKISTCFPLRTSQIFKLCLTESLRTLYLSNVRRTAEADPNRWTFLPGPKMKRRVCKLILKNNVNYKVRSMSRRKMKKIANNDGEYGGDDDNDDRSRIGKETNYTL